jgi:hypothetical protein
MAAQVNTTHIPQLTPGDASKRIAEPRKAEARALTQMAGAEAD